VKRVKRDFIEGLWVKSQQMREDEWKSIARRKLYEFEDQLQAANDAGINSYSGQRSWSFLNAVIYSLSIVTTIGTRLTSRHSLNFNWHRSMHS
jgi:potassium channel subfamily K member 18